ncbi:hypothetical protein [Sharpea azabuensis]|uniref:hypothetical protein n=1 Tax=Sharpea azabuensis TaxID=322505 RepID=UPI00156A32E8|nr:hypothetical protein [Sharpea azabuensis]
MRIIDADKFLTWLIFSKHIEGLTCGEVKEAIEMCKVDILDKIRAEIEKLRPNLRPEQMTDYDYARVDVVNDIVAIFDKYKVDRSVEDGNNTGND